MTARAKSAIEQRLDQFELYVDRKQSIGALPTHTGAVFDSFLSSYAPTQNEYVITLLNGRLYEHRSLTHQPPVLLQQRPNIIADWSQATQHQMTAIHEGDRHYQSIATGFQVNGSVRGTIVILYDSTADFQHRQQALLALLRYVLIFLGISFGLAWITAGRVLRPLRLMTKTAQSITKSDMTQRIATQGHDEIAELGMAFNDMLDRLQLAFDSGLTQRHQG